MPEPKCMSKEAPEDEVIKLLRQEKNFLQNLVEEVRKIMKISYDPRYNIAYIQFREKASEVETIRISDEVNIDISPDGKIYGIELLNANEQLPIISEKALIFINESTGKIIRIPINIE